MGVQKLTSCGLCAFMEICQQQREVGVCSFYSLNGRERFVVVCIHLDSWKRRQGLHIQLNKVAGLAELGRGSLYRNNPGDKHSGREIWGWPLLQTLHPYTTREGLPLSWAYLRKILLFPLPEALTWACQQYILYINWGFDMLHIPSILEFPQVCSTLSHCYKFISSTSLLFAVNRISAVSGSYNYSASLSQWSLSLGRKYYDRNVPFRANNYKIYFFPAYWPVVDLCVNHYLLKK